MKANASAPTLLQNALGRLVTFEGLDGTGKSTQIKLLADALEARGLKVMLTREPGGTALGEEVRTILVRSRPTRIWAEAELALLFASRAQLLREIIEPALLAGRWVLCDRFVDSSLAYQGNGRRLGSAVVTSLHKSLVKDFQPWMTVLLDGDLSLSLSRARGRNRVSEGPEEGRFEAEDHSFYKRVQKGFQEVALRHPERVFQVDASEAPMTIHQRIIKEFDRRLNLLRAALPPQTHLMSPTSQGCKPATGSTNPSARQLRSEDAYDSGLSPRP